MPPKTKEKQYGKIDFQPRNMVFSGLESIIMTRREKDVTPPQAVRHSSEPPTTLDIVASPEQEMFPAIRFGVYPEPGDSVTGRWLSNEDLVAQYGPRTFKGDSHTPESIEELLGSETRYIAAENETVYNMAVKALEKVDGDPSKVAVFVFVTSIPTGEGELEKLKETFGFFNVQAETYIHAACSGGAMGFGFAKEYIDQQKQKALAEGNPEEPEIGDVVIVTSEKYSPTLEDPMDRGGFTDGARVMWFNPKDIDIIAVENHVFPDEASLIAMPVDESKLRMPYIHIPVPYAPKFSMIGRGVHRFVIGTIPKLINGTLEALHLNLSDVDVVATHQPSIKTLEGMRDSKEMKGHEKKVVIATKIGNASSGALFGALKQAHDEGKLHPGALAVAAGFGAGIAASIVVLLMKSRQNSTH